MLREKIAINRFPAGHATVNQARIKAVPGKGEARGAPGRGPGLRHGRDVSMAVFPTGGQQAA